MLVLTRKQGERVLIGDNIAVTVVEIKGNRVRLAFDAPNQVQILRAELVDDLAEHDLEEKLAEWNDHAFDAIMSL